MHAPEDRIRASGREWTWSGCRDPTPSSAAVVSSERPAPSSSPRPRRGTPEGTRAAEGTWPTSGVRGAGTFVPTARGPSPPKVPPLLEAPLGPTHPSFGTAGTGVCSLRPLPALSFPPSPPSSLLLPVLSGRADPVRDLLCAPSPSRSQGWVLPRGLRGATDPPVRWGSVRRGRRLVRPFPTASRGAGADRICVSLPRSFVVGRSLAEGAPALVGPVVLALPGSR